MNILLINHYAGSPSLGMEYRPYYMARDWKNAGHNVRIVAANFAHVRSTQPKTYGYDMQTEIDGIEYLFLDTPSYSGNGIGRIKNMYKFIRKLKKFEPDLADNFKPDAVIASSTYPLDVYSSHRIAKKAGAKFIYEVHDLWPLSPMELGGYSKWHPFIMIMQRAENYAYKNCNAVVSMLPKALEHMKEHGLNPEKFHYIPNGIITNEWDTSLELPQQITELFTRLKNEGRQIVAYAGSHGIANALGAFIDASKFIDKSKISLVLLGDGPEKEMLREKVKQEKHENVHLLNGIKKNLIPSFLDKCDILFIGLQNQSLFRFGISPNKLIDYMMAAKPIVQAINAGNNMVTEANCGISVEPENPQAIAEAINKLALLSENERKNLGENGKKFCLENHDYKVLSQRFIEVMQ